MSTYCFGIDVGGTSVKCGLFLTDGTLLDKWEIPTRTEDHGERILPDVAQTIKEKLAEKKISDADVTGIGMGIPGSVDKKGEVLIAVNLHWRSKSAASELQELTGFPVQVGNDANLAALGETWKGAAEGAKDAVMITLGTGIGGGIIVNGKMVTGYHGCGGEVGHIHVSDEITEPCNCGARGCLEQIASATGIVRTARRILAEHAEEESSLRNCEALSAKDVLDAYSAGDAAAVRTMDIVGTELGKILAVFTGMVDPEIIVVGGGVSKAGAPLIDCISNYYRKYAFELCRDTRIVKADLGNDAGIYGAACMILQYMKLI